MSRLERILDANLNRAAEGLRVLEDCARFGCDDAGLARRAKDLRHRLRAAVPADAIAWRDTAGDVGTAIDAEDEGRRRDVAAVVRANAARVAEALRALGEWAKLAHPALAERAEEARYALYRIERDLLSRLPAWRLWRTRLYAIVDPALCADPEGVARGAAAGGAGAVQLRAKSLGERAYLALARRVQEAVLDRDALFVVNDHAAVATALAADALHLGQDDLPIAEARRVVGPLCAIGCSTHSLEQLHAAQEAGADYVGIGPMHATATKPHEPERGPALLDAVRDALRVPSFAIGGLDAERVRALREALPHGIAVAGAICRAEDPERATAELVALLDEPAGARGVADGG